MYKFGKWEKGVEIHGFLREKTSELYEKNIGIVGNKTNLENVGKTNNRNLYSKPNKFGKCK